MSESNEHEYEITIHEWDNLKITISDLDMENEEGDLNYNIECSQKDLDALGVTTDELIEKVNEFVLDLLEESIKDIKDKE